MADALRLARRQLRRARRSVQHSLRHGDLHDTTTPWPRRFERLTRRQNRLWRRVEGLLSRLDRSAFAKAVTPADSAPTVVFHKLYIKGRPVLADGSPVVHELQQRALGHEHPYEPYLEYSRVPVERVNVHDSIVVDGVKMTFEEVLARPDWRELLTDKDEGS